MLITRLAVVFLAAFTSTRADDSLKDAYHAVQKRMISERIAASPVVYYSRPYVYGDGQPEDIGYGFQKNIGPDVGYNSASEAINYADLARDEFDDRAANALEKLLLDYIEESKGPHPRFNERLSSVKRSSVFRERDPDLIQRALEESEWVQSSPFRERGKGFRAAEHGQKSSGSIRGLRRGGGVGEGSNPGPYSLPGAQDEEDAYLNTIGTLWEKYKDEQDPEQLTEEDLEDVLEYLGAKDMKKRPYGNSYASGYDFFNSPIAWKRKASSAAHHKRYEGGFDDRYPYRTIEKRFPITKRSSSYYPLPLERRKKSEVKTDAKTAAELNNIFDTANNSSSASASEVAKVPAANKSAKTAPTQAPSGQKEQALVGTQAGKPLELKPLELKKKSINWSDYFGYDRKKKSSDWLVDQYLREYGLSPMAKRRSQEQHQQPAEAVDSKMRAMEDMIVDDALKFTGSHEGTRDAKEIQAVKDRVMSELAAAYSLEKIRRALGEFKSSIAAQKISAPSSHNIPSPSANDDDYKPAEEGHSAEDKKKKKTSAILPKIDKKQETNEIRNPYRVDETEDFNDECPIIDDITDRCNYIAVNTGNDKFLQVCGFHQLCSICGVDQGVVTEKQCDRAFVNETSDLCNGDLTCLRSARLQLYVINNFPGPELDCNQNYNPCLYNILNSVFRRRR